MAYFQSNEQRGYQPAPPQGRPPVPAEEMFIDEDEDMYGEEEELTREERRERRRVGFQVLAGVSDFFGTVLGVVAILALVALLMVMWNWIRGDVFRSLSLLERIL